MEPNNTPHIPQAENNKMLIPISIIVAGALVAGAIYFGGAHPTSAGNAAAAAQAAPTAGVVAPVTASDHILGNTNAKIVIVEYSDLECPFCKVFQGTLHDIMNDYPQGEVAWVFREFPIAQLHSKAPNEAAAAECAAQLGGNTVFWNFIDEVFATTNSNNSLDPAELPKIAGDVGLNVDQFNNCLASGTNTALITADVTAAEKAGAQGTPFSVILSNNGKTQTVIDGAQPEASVKATIDGLLK